MMIVFIYGETNISKVSQPPAGPRSFCWMVGWLDGWMVGVLVVGKKCGKMWKQNAAMCKRKMTEPELIVQLRLFLFISQES